jgi:hypothetical protein
VEWSPYESSMLATTGGDNQVRPAWQRAAANTAAYSLPSCTTRACYCVLFLLPLHHMLVFRRHQGLTVAIRHAS